MPMMAAAFPILPGKTDDWRAWMAEANGARRAEFEASRAEHGIHERAYLQHTPMGDLVIVTMEGADPGRAFGQMMNADTDFARWFAGKAKEIRRLRSVGASGRRAVRAGPRHGAADRPGLRRARGQRRGRPIVSGGLEPSPGTDEGQPARTWAAVRVSRPLTAW